MYINITYRFSNWKNKQKDHINPTVFQLQMRLSALKSHIYLRRLLQKYARITLDS